MTSRRRAARRPAERGPRSILEFERAGPTFPWSVLGACLAVAAGPLAPGALSAAEIQVPAATTRPAARATADAIDSARRLVDSIMAAGSVPGLSVAVGRGSEVLWSEGLGYADLTHGIMVTPLTKFRVGSVSKPMTAAAVGHLIEAGALDLDAPVQNYVPAFPEKRWPVSTRHAAGHLAGIRHYRGMENFSAVRYPSVVAGLAIFRDDSLESEPGAEYSYSSYGWNLVSAVVEGAAGVPFLSYMDSVVFRPLGMRHTKADHADSIVSHRTRFYVRGADGRVLNAPHVDNSYKWAGGGFLSTPEDLLRFAAAHHQPGYLRQETLELLFASQRLRSGEETGYGVGWRNYSAARGERVVGHSGGSVGGTTILTLNRDTGLVVAVVANLSNAPLGATLAARLEALFTQGEAPPARPGTEVRFPVGRRSPG